MKEHDERFEITTLPILLVITVIFVGLYFCVTACEVKAKKPMLSERVDSLEQKVEDLYLKLEGKTLYDKSHAIERFIPYKDLAK